MKKHNNLFWISILSLYLFAPGFSFAQGDDISKLHQKHYLIDDGFGAQGYDVVAYFNDNKAVEGNKKYKHAYNGITYIFKSEGNLSTFKSNPDKYEPTYGGWCAYAIAEKSEKMEPDPETFKIQNGKLYLFYNGFFNNTMKTWNKTPTEYEKKADVNWDKIIKSK